MQIFGSLMSEPDLLSDVDKYHIEPSEFSYSLDRYIYSAIYNLYAGGAQKIRTLDIDNYLSKNELAKKLIEEENGIAFLQDCENYCEVGNFNYYYGRFKKFSLLRELQKGGTNIDEFYCEDPLNSNYTKINDEFEKLTTTDIINRLKGNISHLENIYTNNTVVEESNAYTGVRELIGSLRTKPEVGIKLQGDAFNTITRGGRKGKLYLRSASSGVGKTRSMVGDACNIAYPIRYEPRYGKWISTGAAEPVLYIMTEQDPAEIQTMILAYLTGFNEEIFLYGMYDDNDMERINIALDIMERYKDNMLFARIPDPCASVVKNLFRRYSFQHGIENFFYDYIFSSPAMLEEYRDLKLPEYVCLRMFTTALKNLAIELNAFIMTSTQVSNDDSKDGGFKDFRNIQGAKQIVNLVDFGCIMSRPSNEELQEVSGFQKLFNFSPNCVTDVFKNRRGRWTMVRIWSMHDLGTCRKYDLFVTTYDNKPIEEFQIVDFSLKKTKEMEELEELYNNGVVTEEHYEELLDKISKDYPIEANITNDLLEAYGDKKERRQQMSNKSLSDFFD